MVISKNCKISSEIKFEIENVEYVRQKLWVDEQWESDDQENKIKTTLIINYLFYLHNNWYVEVKCQIGWMDGKAGLQQSKNFVTELMGEWMDGWNKIKL